MRTHLHVLLHAPRMHCLATLFATSIDEVTVDALEQISCAQVLHLYVPMVFVLELGKLDQERTRPRLWQRCQIGLDDDVVSIVRKPVPQKLAFLPDVIDERDREQPFITERAAEERARLGVGRRQSGGLEPGVLVERACPPCWTSSS